MARIVLQERSGVTTLTIRLRAYGSGSRPSFLWEGMTLMTIRVIVQRLRARALTDFTLLVLRLLLLLVVVYTARFP